MVSATQMRMKLSAQARDIELLGRAMRALLYTTGYTFDACMLCNVLNK